MANLKNITELPVAESADGLNLIVNDNGAAKQIAASAVGAQADFSVTDETSPAFIKNKVQVDWSQNDPAKPDYMKNRTHYTEIEEITVIGFDKELYGFPAFAVGDTVTIKVDGVTYTLEAYNDVDEDRPVIGDTRSEAESGSGTFGWTVYCYNGLATFYSNYTHTVSYAVETVHKLDAKYLPDGVGGGERVMIIACRQSGEVLYTSGNVYLALRDMIDEKSWCNLVLFYHRNGDILCRHFDYISVSESNDEQIVVYFNGMGLTAHVDGEVYAYEL